MLFFSDKSLKTFLKRRLFTNNCHVLLKGIRRPMQDVAKYPKFINNKPMMVICMKEVGFRCWGRIMLAPLTRPPPPPASLSSTEFGGLNLARATALCASRVRGLKTNSLKTLYPSFYTWIKNIKPFSKYWIKYINYLVFYVIYVSDLKFIVICLNRWCVLLEP